MQLSWWFGGLVAAAMSSAGWAAPPVAAKSELSAPAPAAPDADRKRQELKAAIQNPGLSAATTPVGLDSAARQQLRQQLKAHN
jgi:hypothetical protein